jgi:hypothetical protein
MGLPRAYDGRLLSYERLSRREALQGLFAGSINSLQKADRENAIGEAVWRRLSATDLQLLRFVLHSGFETEYSGLFQPGATSLVGHHSAHEHDNDADQLDGDDVLFAQGYEVIARHLTEPLAACIRLNEAVQAIDHPAAMCA